MISPHLVNAGLGQATGRYVALIHHQDLVYQHAYCVLIGRLQSVPIAFGGIRVATHGYGRRHWMVTTKEQVKPQVAPLNAVANGRGAIHAFVADREQLDPDYLTVRQPTARLATTVFLNRLTAHPKADFSLSGMPMFESRTPPRLSAEADLERLPPLKELVTITAKASSVMPAAKARSKPDYKSIPIFINARDLFVSLRQLVIWLLEAGYSSISVIDNNSSYPALLEFYKTMRRDIRVIRLGINVGHTAIWDLKLLDRLGITGPYVWTDPDIVPIEECPKNVLEFFWTVLQAYPHTTKVGFGLRIDDLPDHYRFKQRVIAWETQFWERKIAPKLYDATIDTTFALYRPGSGYDLVGIRTGFPYLASHAPWYENSSHPSEDHAYYIKNARSGINSWGGENLPTWLDAATQQ